jgi:hypothetical protein
VLHEFGHALGFGISGQGAPNFYSRFVSGDGFTGPNAVREYRSRFGDKNTSIPLETGGGPGTAGAHWRESVFDTELMTGFSEAAGVAMQLSAITVGALEDMGYTVNYAAADPYTAPAGLSPGLGAGGTGDAWPIARAATRSPGRSNGSGISENFPPPVEGARISRLVPVQQDGHFEQKPARTSRDRLFAGLPALESQTEGAARSPVAWRAFGRAASRSA